MTRRERIVPLAPRPLLPVHLASEVDPATVRAMLRDGTWVRARSGAYVENAHLDDVAQRLAAERGTRPTSYDVDRARALAGVSAVVVRGQRRGAPELLVRVSAALVLGLDGWTVPTRTHVARRDFPGRGTAPDLAVHTAAVHDDETVMVHGARVTGVVRTALDIARFGPVRDGTVVLDRALRAGVPRATFAEAVARLGSVPGARRARVALEHADDGAESPWESWTRVRALAFGLPRPTTQLEIVTDIGIFYVDMAWPELRLVVEYDGRVKYDDLAAGDPARVVAAEKEREDAVRAQGWAFVRMTATHLSTPGLFEGRLRRALAACPRVPLTPRPGLLLRA